MSVCTVTGTVDRGASPLAGSPVRCRTLVPVDGAIHVAISAVTTQTASDGTYSVVLEQGSVGRIEIFDCGIDKWGTVPSTATATVETVLATWNDSENAGFDLIRAKAVSSE